MVWTFAVLWPMDAEQTARHSTDDDPGRTASDVLVVAAATVSLGAAALLLIHGAHPAGRQATAALALASIGAAWATVHTTYSTRYAQIYDDEPVGGIEFHQDGLPGYRDFMYVAFTIGMAFQVSDTDLQSAAMRSTALRHSLLSYLFGAVIIGGTINLIAGLGEVSPQARRATTQRLA